MIYTYLLKSVKDGSYYVGISKNPKRRLKYHNSGDNFSTKGKIPWKLVYIKLHSSYKEARKHEIWLKKKEKVYKQKLESFGGDLSHLK